jgi:hypothetical protein
VGQSCSPSVSENLHGSQTRRTTQAMQVTTRTEQLNDCCQEPNKTIIRRHYQHCDFNLPVAGNSKPSYQTVNWRS